MRSRMSILGVSLAMLAACGGAGTAPTALPSTSTPTGAATPAPTPTLAPTLAPTPTPDRSRPVGLIAIGHSGITGEGTAGPGVARPDRSWATGTLATVNSVYLRMVAILPETEGHVANAGQGGAAATQLVTMGKRALVTVPVPELAIIQAIDGDIQCDGRDLERVTGFGDNIRAAVQLFVDASPNGHVLIVGQLGRPTAAGITDLVEQVPAMQAALTGTGPCDFYDPSGELNLEHIASLVAIIDALEAEQATVCATFSQCATDGGARKAFNDSLENHSDDLDHLNVRGQAAVAELIWPVVEELLGR